MYVPFRGNSPVWTSTLPVCSDLCRTIFQALPSVCPPLFGDTVFPQYPQEIGFKPAHMCMTKSTDAQVPYVDVGLAKAGYRVTVLISHVRLHLKRHSLTKINFKEGNHGRNIILMTASFLFKTKIASLVYNYKRDTCTFSKIQAIQKCKN